MEEVPNTENKNGSIISPEREVKPNAKGTVQTKNLMFYKDSYSENVENCNISPWCENSTTVTNHSFFRQVAVNLIKTK